MTDIAEDLHRITAAVSNGHNRLQPEMAPDAVRRVANAIAEELRPLNLGVIACWVSPANAVLGFAVAESLGLPAVHISEEEGLLYTSWEVPPARMALIGAVGDYGRPDVARTVFSDEGHTPVAAVQVSPGTAEAPSHFVVTDW
jgi:hypothetical protein